MRGVRRRAKLSLLTPPLHNIEQLETDLWAAADNLRANSKLTSSEYCMPVLGIIFLRHATNRYDDAVRQIEADQAASTMPKRPLVKGDFLKRRALQLPPEARYDTLLGLPTGASLGAAIVKAMDAIERDFEPLKGHSMADLRAEHQVVERLLDLPCPNATCDQFACERWYMWTAAYPFKGHREMVRECFRTLPGYVLRLRFRWSF